ncbi:FUSC family protein [Methylobacterium sp. J-059]|uniref:FUSC family protein n=1 Tax=Methylobacterium sp. J-059 TaxID=2836643 RepID=UPI001FBBFF10|nr:FUSC family protein [Methylobacterium sp. J-059]MCJ2042825.1 FUSC family protein [Methylobacterium sp. J-059]
MSEAATETTPWLGRMVDRLDAIVPKPAAWAFALRIWLAMMLALYAAFWLQLDSASSAATGVAILAQPKRGQAISKAAYRFLGTVIGGIVAIVFMALFAQDRVTLLVAFAVWIGVCVFIAQYLQDTRAYGAMLSGYTVAIIALAHIDAPQSTFDAAVGRLAAITVAIVTITFINDALASPSTWRTLLPTLASAYAGTKTFAREAFTSGDPGALRTAALIRTIAPMRADASAIAGELDDGPYRAAGARSAIAALYVMAAASRAAANAAASLRHPSSAVEEAIGLCREVASGGVGEPDAGRLDRIDARLRDLVDAAVRDGRRPLDELVALQRCLDFVNAATFADDGLRALADGHVPLRDVKLPTHRDFPVALRAALRVAIGFGLTAAFMVLSGLPQTSFALVQVASTCALSSTAPDPKKFAVGVLIGMPLASLFAGIVLFGFLNGNQGFPLLAIAMIVPVFVACFLSLNPSTFGIGFIALVFTPVLIAPENPQSYDPQTFLMNAVLVMASAVILFLAVRLVLPISASQHRAFALDSAKRALAEALAGEGGDATTRTSLNADRLFQFAGYTSGSRAVRHMAMVHAFALSQLESAAARAHAQMRLLSGTEAMRAPVAKGREALARGDAWRLQDAARDLLRAAADHERGTRMTVARAATDLVAAARVIERHRRFLVRLDMPGF